MTQKEAVRNYLSEFGSITSLQAFIDLGITRLAARIDDLRKDGLGIKAEPVTGKNRYGHTVTYAKYSIMEDKEND